MAEVKLPEGWVRTVVGEVFYLKNGFAFKSESFTTANDSTFPVIRISDLDGIYATDEKSVHVFSPAKGFEIRNGDLLIAMSGATTGKVGIYKGREPAFQNQRVGNIKFQSELMNDRLFRNYLIFSIESDVTKNAYGGAQPNISGKDIEAIEFNLPPFPEQKIIAERLDSLVAQVATIKARLDAIPALLKRFRQSVISAAVSGKLTEEWRGNDIRFTARKGMLASFVSIDVGHAFKSKEFTDSGIRLLRGQNIEPGSLKWTETKFSQKENLERFSHLFINEGDVVLAMDRPIISNGLKLARAKLSDLPCVLVQRVARFVNYKGITPEYLYLILRDIGFLNHILPNQTGSDIPHISGKQILSFGVLVPELEEQTEIVRRVEQLFAYAESVEQQVAVAQSRVNQLTQAILAKAFSGELTADWRAAHPELISGEHSAAALLARIQAERAASAKPARSTRRNATA